MCTMDGRRRTQSRTSLQTSELTGEFSQQGFQSYVNCIHQDLPVTESMSAEWTDEKHSLYLKSMEASFVNQLYNSLDLLGSSLRKEMSDPKLSQQEGCDTCTPAGQFKVLRGGCWQKIKFQRPQSQHVANESHGLLESPWIQHFSTARKHQFVSSPTPQESAASKTRAINLGGKKGASSGSATISKHYHLCHSHSCQHDLFDSKKEVSDQNFVDEVVEGAKTSSACSSKRMKTDS